MRVADQLYFAPKVSFSQVDWTGAALPDQFEARIHGFYLGPAISLAGAGHAFGSGALLVVTVDAIARVDSNKTKVGERIRDWCERRIPSLSDPNMRQRFNEDFRNGLVHEARVKNGSEFNLHEAQAAVYADSRLILNPKLLAHEVSSGLSAFVAKLKDDTAANHAFVDRLRSEFLFERTH